MCAGNEIIHGKRYSLVNSWKKVQSLSVFVCVCVCVCVCYTYYVRVAISVNE